MFYHHTTPDQRLAALQLAAEIGNVAQACRHFKLDRTSFYRWRKRYEKEGAEGLLNRSRARCSYSRAIPQTTEIKVLTQSMKRPWWGCRKLSQHLRFEGCLISPGSTQAILQKHGIALRNQRMARSESAWYGNGLATLFDSEYGRTLQRWNPRRKPSDWLRFPHVALWHLDYVPVPRSWRCGSAHLLLAIETRAGYACARFCHDPVDAYKLLQFMEGTLRRHLPNAWSHGHRIELSPRLKAFVSHVSDIYIGGSTPRKLWVDVRCDSEPVSIWSRYLLDHLRKSPPRTRSASEESLSRAVNCRVRAYNVSHQIMGYPHYGRTPNQLRMSPHFEAHFRPYAPKDRMLTEVLFGIPRMPSIGRGLLAEKETPVREEAVRTIEMEAPDNSEFDLLTSHPSWKPTGCFPLFTESITSAASSTAWPASFQTSEIPLLAIPAVFQNPITPEDVFSAIALSGPQRYTRFICGSCVRLLVKDRASRQGVCPLTHTTVPFHHAACDQYIPRGESL